MIEAATAASSAVPDDSTSTDQTSSSQATTSQQNSANAAGFHQALAAADPGQHGAPANTNAKQAANPDPPVSAARKQQIDDWVAHHSDSSGGFLGIFGVTSSAQHVKDALDGKTGELGHLTGNEQSYLMSQVLDRWTAGKGDGPGGAAELAQSLGDDKKLIGVASQGLAAKASQLMQKPAGNGSLDDPHSVARAYALDAIQASSGSLGSTPSDLTPLRNTVTSLGPEGAARFVQALSPTNGGIGMSLPMAQDRVLKAMNAGPHTDATAAVVQNVFADATPMAIQAIPGMQHDMARALAREWHPEGGAAEQADEKRLDGILGTDQGKELLFGRGNDGQMPVDARVNALAEIRSNKSITASTLQQTDDPWMNPAIVAPIAQANAGQFLSLRGDSAQTLSGTDLDNTVGYAMGFQPTVPKGMSATDAEAKAANGQFSYYASGQGAKPVKAVVDQIHALGGANPKVTVLPITYSSGDSGPVQLPLFRVDTPQGERYVDNTGASYKSFQDWKDNNQLPPGTVFYPSQGHLTANADGSVKLDHGDTPATPDTTWKQIKGVLNSAAMVGGIIAGGALIIGTDGLATPIVAGIATASGAWGAYQTGSQLYFRSQHGLSLNPVSDSTARGLWLGLAANTAGMGAFASEAALARIASTEGTLGTTAAGVIGTVKAASNVTNAAAFVNQGVDIAQNWGSMNDQQRAESLLSMGFWGVTALAGARQARTPGEAFNPAGMTRAITDAYEPPVVRNSSVEGNRVEITTDPATGRPIIVAGDKASAADITLHRNMARLMAQDQGLQGQIKGLLGTGEPRPGTLAYNVKMESTKLNQQIASLQSELNKPGLTTQQRTQIQGDIETTQGYLQQQYDSLSGIARDPAQAGIAAPSGGQQRADEIQPGLGNILETGPYAHQGYYLRTTGPDTLPEIVRPNESKPRLALVQGADGKYTVEQVANQPNLPGYESIAGGAPSTARMPAGLSPAEQKGYLDAVAGRAQAVKQRDTANNPETEKAAAQRVISYSNLIGEYGARGYVQAEFKGAEPIYGGPGAGSQRGDFDQVYRQTLSDGRIRYIVVEAKGGTSPLGTKVVGPNVETQGTADYFESTAESMKGMGGNAGTVGKELLSVYRKGQTLEKKPAEIVYLQVRTPTGTSGGSSAMPVVSVKQFDIGGK